MALSLQQIGELKFVAKRDAKKCLQKLLDSRRAGRTLTEDDIHTMKVHSVCAYVDDSHITDHVVILEVGKFYGREFDRQLEALFDLGMAASGKVEA